MTRKPSSRWGFSPDHEPRWQQMIATSTRVALDANVLYPSTLRDTPYADRQSVTDDLDAVAARFRALMPAVIAADLAPDLRIAEILEDLDDELGAGLRVWIGSPDGEDYLLGLRNLAFTASLGSLPLFERLLEYTRPRDQFTTKRRAWVIAGLALLAKRHRSREAAHHLEVLLSVNPDKRLRVAAVDAVARLWRTADDELDADALPLLTAVARDDRDFEPRFAARGWLASMEADPIDARAVEVLAFEATSARVPRTIEVLTTHTLVDLVSAVVTAFSWDHDHLWALTLSTDFEQEDFYVSPEGDPWEVDDGPAAAPLGALGMPVGHRFELVYDLGRRHRVGLRRVAAAPTPKPRAKYPRVASGKPPTK